MRRYSRLCALLIPCLMAGCTPPSPGCETCDTALAEVAITSFRARPSLIAPGDEATLSWTSVHASSCTLAPPQVAVPRSGELTVTPSESTPYRLVCEGPAGPAVAEAIVAVAGAVDGGSLDGGEVDAGGGGAIDGGEVDAGDGAAVDGGAPDAAGDPDAGAAPADAGNATEDLRHRYRFHEDVDELVAVDDVGGAHAQLRGGAYCNGEGALILEDDGSYADLPNGILSSLESVTLEAWVVWSGVGTDGYWQRIFDFGTTSAGEIDDVGGGPFQAESSSFLQLSPATSLGRARVTVNSGTGASAFVDAAGPLPASEQIHVAVSYDANAGELRLYVNGTLEGVSTWTTPLAAIDDVNCWIGRSNYSADPFFHGSFLELRIYASALTTEQIAASFAAGPEVLW